MPFIKGKKKPVVIQNSFARIPLDIKVLWENESYRPLPSNLNLYTTHTFSENVFPPNYIK